jgi:Kef-type K+ transport system membrane component KefB
MSVGDVLRDILVVLIAAKAAAEVAERLALPAVVAEIAAGVLIGPSALRLVGGEDEVLRVLGELGVILLLLQVGLQMDLAELGAVGRPAVLVAATGVAVPFAGGWAVASALGHGGHTAVFIGAALTATSVGITARVFADLRALATVEARTVLGAAVVDDVMGLVILTVVVRVVEAGSVSPLEVAGVVGLALAFLVVATGAGSRLAPPVFAGVQRLARSSGTLVPLALAFTLAVAELASAARLAPIVGAFVAGLALARTGQAERIRRELTPIGHVFVPVFFLQIGIDARLSEFARPAVLGLAAALLVVAVAGKLVSAAGAAGAPGDKLLLGLGMIPRGEVGLIFASLGRASGLLGQDLYAALLLVVLASTLVAPPLLRVRLLALRNRRRAGAGSTSAPAGGHLTVDDGVVDLVAEPPDHLALHVALQAARKAAAARPGPRLLDWLGATADRPLRWDATATESFLRVLREGSVRSWRFLDVSGVLERALPELAETIRRRRADLLELDPAAALRWSLVEKLRAQADDPSAAPEWARLRHPEWLLLAALILETAGEGTSPVMVARRLVKRLELGAVAEQEIALLVGEAGLLRGAAARSDSLAEGPVLQLATHLETAERARALYLLSLALDALELWQRRRLDELHTLVQAALVHPELTGREASNLAQRHRAEAERLVGPGSRVAERIASAPRAYLLAHEASDIARQAALLEPLPARQRARVAVVALPEAGRYRVDVGCRDQAGLLATVAGVLSAAGMSVAEAVVATWPDGGALESFVVTASDPPDPDRLAAALDAAFDEPLAAAPAVALTVTFDDDASPWYTLCDVRGTDRPGLLQILATAFAVAGATIHAAGITTVDGEARDRFDLTDGSGRKLDGAAKDAIRAALAGGVVFRRRRSRRRRRGFTPPKQSVTETKPTGYGWETRVP